MRRPKRGRNNNRWLASRLGIIFVPVIIKVEWGNTPTLLMKKIKVVRKFGRLKTKTQHKRARCLSPGGWKGYR